MASYEMKKPIEVMLRDRATDRRLPFSGGMELLPLCNMRCNMCYIRREKADLLPAGVWLKIARSARDAGVLMLLLTGGEALLHPEFKQIWRQLQKMGFVLTLNTNGALLNEEWADFFCENPCRKINVSLYGACAETYGRLCHCPEGFAKTVNGIRLLKEKNIPCVIHIMLVKENRDDLAGMMRMARELDVPATPVVYAFPPVRGGDLRDFSASRMSPEEAAASDVERRLLNLPADAAQRSAETFFDQLTGTFDPPAYEKGFSCIAGKSSFWINWQGELSACAMIPGPSYDVTEHSFLTAWENVVRDTAQAETCRECRFCRKQFFCPSCAAAMYAENKDMRRAPAYLCRMTDEEIRIMFTRLPSEKQEKYRTAMRDCRLAGLCPAGSGAV